MKAHYFALLSLTACLDASGPLTEGADEPQHAALEETLAINPLTRITISADVAPALVAVREGVNGPWRTPTQVTPQTFHARVLGPFTVLAVCPDPVSPFFVQMFSRTPQDGPLVEVFCGFPDPGQDRQVSGSMVQPGSISFNDRRVSSTSPGWSFQTSTPAGTYDLVASSADRVAVRRNIAVSNNLTLPTIDLALEGTPLLPNPITLTNPVPGEQSEAVVFLMTPGTQPQAQISRGLPGAAKIAPDSVLAAGEDQEVSVRSTFADETTSILRSTRRPIHSGGNSTFSLRQLFTNLQYVIDGRGELVARWGARAPIDFLSFTISDAEGRILWLDATSRYLEATRARQLSFAINAPGFRPEWKVDVTTSYYFRDVFASSTTGATVPGERWGLTISELANWNPLTFAATAPVAPRMSSRLRRPVEL